MGKGKMKRRRKKRKTRKEGGALKRMAREQSGYMAG